MISGGIENDRVICAVLGHESHGSGREVAMHVDDREAATGLHVLVDQIDEKRTFAGSSCTHDIEVAAAGFFINADQAHVAPEEHAAQGRRSLFISRMEKRRRLQLAKLRGAHPFGRSSGSRRMKERRHFLMAEETPLLPDCPVSATNPAQMKSGQARVRERAEGAGQLLDAFDGQVFRIGSSASSQVNVRLEEMPADLGRCRL